MIENLKFSTLKLHAANTIKRFPLFCGLSLAAFLLILISTLLPNDKDEFLEQASFFVFYVSLYAVPFTLVAESLSYSRRRAGLLAALLGTLTWVMHYLAFTPPQFEWALSFASLTLCAVAPFLKDRSNDRLCYYWYTVIQATIWTVIPCLILLLAIGALQFTIDKLFGIKFNNFTEAFLYGGIWALLAPLFFFGQLPTIEHLHAVQVCTTPKPIKIILTWLLIPIALVFFFILYAYFIKAAVTQENVRGVLVNLIIGYSIFGLGVLLSSYPLIAEDNKAAKLLHKYFFLIILLPAAILLWRVWVRIDAYGLTVDRIFASIFAIWLLTTSTAYALRPISDRQLRFIPLCLGIIGLLMYAGPWDPQSLALRNQLNRVVNALTAEGLYKDGHVVIKTPKPHISSIKNQRTIVEGFNYIHVVTDRWNWRKDKRPDPLAPLFEQTPLELPYKEYTYDNASYGYNLLARFAIPQEDKTSSEDSLYSLNFSGGINYGSRTYSVTGYDILIDNVSASSTDVNKRTIYFNTSQSPSTGVLSEDKNSQYGLETTIDNNNGSWLVIAVHPADKDLAVETFRVNLQQAVSPYLKGQVLPNMTGLYLQAPGTTFEAIIRLDRWEGKSDYQIDSQGNSLQNISTRDVAFMVLLHQK